MSVAVLILGSFMEDALDYIIRFQFELSQRQDMTVNFVEPTTSGVRREVEQLPGVIRSEFFRSVPTRIRFGHRSRRVGVMGLEHGGDLFHLIDDREKPVDMPAEGLMLSTKLAELLGADYDDIVTLELLEGNRGTYRIPVTAMVTEFGGTNAYMDARALHRLLREDSHVSGAFLQVDSKESSKLYSRLKQTPQVAGVNVKTAALQSFRDTIAENLNKMRAFNVFFACVIAVGVVYNSARISLAERSRELATLRVIGFTRGEISAILLGELGVLTLAALPLGMLIGYGLAAWATLGLDTEIYRIPLVIDRSTYGFAAMVVLIAAIGSGLSVRRQLNQLDLVAVLKTKE